MSYGIDYQIPLLAEMGHAGSYKDIPIDLADPRSQEPLVKVSDFGIAGDSFYARSDGSNAPYHDKIMGATEYVWSRKTVAEKLVRVNERLHPLDLELYVWDAYRPIQCQVGLWDFFSHKAITRMPEATEAERREYVLTFVSDPTCFIRSDPTTWPVHTCGGAVDLTLRHRKTKALLDMGAGFDEMESISYSDAYERLALEGRIKKTDPCLLNRRLLHGVMIEEGFTNYHFEYWHFDYGDQMYVLNGSVLGRSDVPKKAWYGYVDSPEFS